MKIKNINYQKTFNLGNYSSERIGLEGEVNEGEDLQSVFTELKKLAEEIHKANNPHLTEYQSELDIPVVNYTGVRVNPNEFKPMMPHFLEEPPKPKTPEEKMIEQIEEITDTKVLESFKLLASRNKKIKEAYDNRLKQLTA